MKPILVLARANDTETNSLEEHLVKHALGYIRINQEDKIENLVFDIHDRALRLTINETPVEIDLKMVEVVFWRGEALKHKIYASAQNELDSYLMSNYLKDWKIIIEAIEYTLSKHAFFIGSPQHERNGNKIIDLIKAIECGFSVPKSILCTSNFDVDRFFSGEDKIFKHHGKRVQVFDSKIAISSSNTRSFDKELRVRTIPDEYGPTFFQENITKHFEAKVLYVCGEIIPLGIFSQFNDGECALDYRVKMSDDYLRLGNICVPDDIDRRIRRFVADLDLNICVIDFIINEQGEFIFLEVNPTGRFNWIYRITNINPYEIIVKKIKDERRSRREAKRLGKSRGISKQERESHLPVLESSSV